MNELNRHAPRPVFHLVANSHIDPVWLWTWSEGLNEALSTVTTVLKLMRERTELTYIRGETLIYDELRRNAPSAFATIKRLVREGRWDPVGATYVQPDMNLTAVETLHRHFDMGQQFFHEHFQRRAWAGWSADCFGHSPFLPDILLAHGLRAYAFGRPNPPNSSKLFWWESPNGKRVLTATYATGWYGCERDEINARLDAYRRAAPSLPVQQVFVPFGLGNHGGGPTRRHLDDIASWAARHPEVEVRYSTLHAFFAAVEWELKTGAVRLPVVQGDLGFCMRGTYSTGLALKTAYRQAESRVIRLTKLLKILPRKSAQGLERDLGVVWQGVLFNSFHDILPATASRSALAEQVEQLGGVIHGCRVLEREALLSLSHTANVRLPTVPADHPKAVPFLVVNPHSHAYRGLIELEACLDYRPLWKFKDRVHEVPLVLHGPNRRIRSFQVIRIEHNFMAHLPWRQRIVFAATIPAKSCATFTLGWKPDGEKVRTRVLGKTAVPRDLIRTSHLRIHAQVGAAAISVRHDGKPLLARPGLSAILVEDPYGPWGGHYEENASLELLEVRERWKIVSSRVTEAGPIRWGLWCRLAGARSRLDLTFSTARNDHHLAVDAAVFLNDERARLKLVLPGGDVAHFSVPGGVIRRGPQGEVPGGRWAQIDDRDGHPRFIFASDTLYNFNTRDGCFYATVVRSSRYAMDLPESEANLPPEEPVQDSGTFRFRFLIGKPSKRTLQSAESLEQPVLVATVPTSHTESMGRATEP